MSDVPVPPRPVDAVLDLADLALAQGHPERALQHVGEVLGTGQEPPRAVLLAARALHALNNPTAVQYASRLCELRPGQAAPLRVRAEILLAFGARDAARPDVAEALRLDPTSAVGHALAAATSRTARGYRRSMRRAIELNPTDASLLVYLAALSIQVRRLREADRLLRQALELDPGEPRALTLRAGLRSRRGPWAAGSALADQSALVRADPGSRALATSYDRHGAVALYRAVLVMLLGSIWSLMALGQSSARPGGASTVPLISWGLGVVWVVLVLVRSGADGRRDLRHLVTQGWARSVPVLVGLAGPAAAVAAVRPSLAPAATPVAAGAQAVAALVLWRLAVGRRRASPVLPPSRAQLVPGVLIAALLVVTGVVLAWVAVAPPDGTGWTTGPSTAALIALALGGWYVWRFVVGLRRRRRWHDLTASGRSAAADRPDAARRR